MDGQRFDDLTQRLTSHITRRRFGQALATIGLGLGPALAPKASAKKPKKKKKKKGGGCTPDCAGKACGAADGCTGRCNQGSCPVTQTCQSGQCLPDSSCTPACASDRECSEGKCKCSLDSQCARDRDPNGFDCLNSVTNPFCGCRPFTGQNRRVCVAGEPCSVCCSAEECQAKVPELPDIICASLPLNALVGRFCCVPQGGLCGGNSQCCGGSCVGNVCSCNGSGQNCSAHEACCSNQCGTPANPFTCM